MMLQAIDMAGLSARDRLPYWNELAGRYIAPIQVEPVDRDTFEARLFRASLRDFEIVSPCSAPARIRNGAGPEAGTLNLQLQHVGTSVNTTAGRTSILKEGDFLLFDPARPLELSFTEPTQTIVLRLPLAGIEARLPRLRRMAGVPIRGQSGAGALFSAFVRRAWAQIELGENDWGDELSDVIWPLLDLAYAPVPDSGPPQAPRAARRRAVLDFIEAQLCDPALDTGLIAARMGMSARSVQLMFAAMSTTPRQFIQDRRLERAAARLARESGVLTITSLAFESGFNDLSAFCRAFRRRFGATPSDYRQNRGRPALHEVPLL
jgi:AraC family transcriptional regulator, positive regulator of tynA and feaB